MGAVAVTRNACPAWTQMHEVCDLPGHRTALTPVCSMSYTGLSLSRVLGGHCATAPTSSPQAFVQRALQPIYFRLVLLWKCPQLMLPLSPACPVPFSRPA